MSAFWATVSQTEKAETPRRTKNELNAECLLWPSTACTGSDLPGALGTLISQVGLGAVSQPPAAPGQGDGPVLPANVVVAKPGEVAAVSGVRAGVSRVLLSENAGRSKSLPPICLGAHRERDPCPRPDVSSPCQRTRAGESSMTKNQDVLAGALNRPLLTLLLPLASPHRRRRRRILLLLLRLLAGRWHHPRGRTHRRCLFPRRRLGPSLRPHRRRSRLRSCLHRQQPAHVLPPPTRPPCVVVHPLAPILSLLVSSQQPPLPRASRSSPSRAPPAHSARKKGVRSSLGTAAPPALVAPQPHSPAAASAPAA